METAQWLTQYRKRRDSLPRLALGTFPTPVRRIELATGGAFWVKDDGGCSDLYGGNKVRKLEYFLAHAEQRGVRRLIVWGDPESHTVMATALLGRHAGFEVEAVVFPCGQPAVEEACLGRLEEAGVRVRRAPNMLAGWLVARLRAMRAGGSIMPLGCSSPLSMIGYIEAALELHEQIGQGLCPTPQRIFAALGSGGTVAGLLIGLALASSPTRVVAVRTVDRIVTPASKVRRLVARTLRLLDLPKELDSLAMDRLERIDEGYLGRGYRDAPTVVREATDIAAAEGLVLEPIFTGKAMACLLGELSAHPDGQLLFWNTHDRVNSGLCSAAPRLPAATPLAISY